MVKAWKLVNDVDAKFGLYARLILWLFALLLLTRFSVLDAVLTVAVVVGQVFLGSQFVARYRAIRGLSALSRVGISFCLGATVSTFIYIFVVTFSNRWVAILGQVALLVGAFVLWRFSRVLGISERRAGMTLVAETVAATSEEKLAVKWIVVVTLLGLSPDWFWPLPVAVVLTASIFIFDRVRSKAILVRLAVAAVCGAGAVFVWMRILETRPIRPWFADDRFAEIFSFSLGRWGVSNNPILIGETISYHWFSYAWVGALSNLTGVQISVILPLFGPMIIAAVSAILCVVIVLSFLKKLPHSIVVVAVVVLIDTERFFRGFGFHAFQLASFSQLFSLPFGLAIVLLVIRLEQHQMYSVSLILGVIFAGVIGAKSSSGLFVLFGLLGICFNWFLSNSDLGQKFRFLIFAISVPAVLSGLFFYGNPLSGTASVIRRPGWPVGVSRDLWDVYNGSFVRFLPILIFLTIALAGTGILSLVAINFFKIENLSIVNLRLFFIFGTIATTIQMWIAQSDGSGNLVSESDNTLWALQYFVALTVVVGLSIVGRSIIQNFKSFRFSFLCISILSLVMVTVLRSWKIEFTPSYWTSILESLKPALPLIFSCIFSLLFALAISAFGKLKVSFFSLVLALGGFSVAISGLYLFTLNYNLISERQQNEWVQNDVSYMPSTDYISATRWLNSNSKYEDLIATKVTSQSPKISELTGRREFAGFELLMRVAGSYSEYERVKRQFIEDFAGKGDCESAEGLRANDVAFVLVDLTNPDTPDVERCAKEAFRNETVIVYSLK